MCMHSGAPNIPNSQCAACNGIKGEKPEFHGRRQVEEESRLRKGRDSAEWVGRFPSMGNGGTSMREAAASCGRRVTTSMLHTYTPTTSWGREQVARDRQEILKMIGILV